MLTGKQENFDNNCLERINAAVSFIDEHLDEDLSIETVAAVAYYSPFHFHRVFKQVFKEPLHTYIVRIRLEKTASILMRDKKVAISTLAMTYGFKSNAVFTRTFKKKFGVTPSEFRLNCLDRFSKLQRINSKNGQVQVAFEQEICTTEAYKQWFRQKATIELKTLPAMSLAYISHIGITDLEQTYEKLFKWSQLKGVLDATTTQFVTIYHDSFKITEAHKIRRSACLLLKRPVEASGPIGIISIPKGKYVVCRIEIDRTSFAKAWSSLFIWLYDNGYRTIEQCCIEIYYNDFKAHPRQLFVVDLCVPVR